MAFIILFSISVCADEITRVDIDNYSNWWDFGDYGISGDNYSIERIYDKTTGTDIDMEFISENEEGLYEIVVYIRADEGSYFSDNTKAYANDIEVTFKKFENNDGDVIILVDPQTNCVVPVDGSVIINSINFPDNSFREYISQKYDTTADGVLSNEEMQSVITMNVTDKNIESIIGINYFKYLTDLNVSYNNISEMDISSLTQLERLWCNNNDIKELNINNNTKLKYINADVNSISNIDISKNTELDTLNIEGNKLTSFSMLNNPKLENLFIKNNCLTRLDVESNAPMNWLSVGEQTTQVIIPEDRKFYMPLLGDVSKITMKSGGTLEGDILTVDKDAKSFVYEYYTGNGSDVMKVTAAVTFGNVPFYEVGIKYTKGGTAEADIAKARAGDKVTVNLKVNNGYRFEYWLVKKGNVKISNNSFVMGIENVELVAVFVPEAAPKSKYVEIETGSDYGILKDSTTGNISVRLSLSMTSGVLVYAGYDRDGILKNATLTNITLGDILAGYIIIPTFNGNTAEEKLMLWRNMTDITPLCQSEKI